MTTNSTTNKFNRIAALFNRINHAVKVCDLTTTVDLTVAEVNTLAESGVTPLLGSLLMSQDETRNLDRKLTTLVLTEMKYTIENAIDELESMGVSVDGSIYAAYVQDPEEL